MSIILSTPMISNPSFEIPAYPPGTNNNIATGVVVKDWSLYVGPSSFPVYAGISNALNAAYGAYSNTIADGNQCLYLHTPSSSTIEESSYAQTTITGLVVGNSYVIKCYVSTRPNSSYNNSNITIKINATAGDYTTGTIIYINNVSGMLWTQITCNPFTATSSSTLMTVMSDGSLGDVNTDRTLLVDAFSIENYKKIINKPALATIFYNGFTFKLKDPTTNKYVGIPPGGSTEIVEKNVDSNAIIFKIKSDKSVYNNNLGAVAIQAVSGTNYNNGFMRHAFYYMYSDPFVANNFDFAWVFMYVRDNMYYLYNYYSDNGSPYYANYDAGFNQLNISNTPRKWIVESVVNPGTLKSNIKLINLNVNVKQYPPVALTGSTTILSGLSYGNGTYIVTQGTFEGNDPYDPFYEGWHAFDKNTGINNRWSTESAYDSMGNPTTTLKTTPSNGGGISYTGDYIQITLPYQIVLRSYSFYDLFFWYSNTPVNTPNTWLVLGTNDSSPSSTGNWFIVDKQSNITWPDYPYQTIPLTFSGKTFTSYKTYRFVITKTNYYDPRLTITEIILYGYT